ncbi:MAG TPA: hypothetical protein VIJ14_08585 [Rhabdochlamydiaceae bacterium]
MKRIILFALLLMSGCATTPRITVRDCRYIGSGLYSCQELPKGDVERKGY